jgi:hypothetical protein
LRPTNRTFVGNQGFTANEIDDFAIYLDVETAWPRVIKVDSAD